MSGNAAKFHQEVRIMCNNGFFGCGNNCWWIIILILLFSCCGNGMGMSNCGCGNNCGCDNNCC